MRNFSARILGIVAAVSTTAEIANAAPLNKPLLPIMFQTNWADVPYPDYTQSELREMAQESEGVWGSFHELPKDDGDIMDLSYLRSQDAQYKVIAYLNAGHQGWSETNVDELEDDRLNLIQMYHATELADSIGTTETQIRVLDNTMVPVSGGAVNLWSAVRSLDGETGPDGGYISFIRIDNEIMRVKGRSDTNPPKLNVIRGTDGTNPASHAEGAFLLAPVFVTDYNPNGMSAIAQGYVRYSLNVGTPELPAFLVRNFMLDFLNRGLDGAWLDITAPSFYNMVGAYNVPVDGDVRDPFNTIEWADYTLTTRAGHHDRKIGRIQEDTLAATGRLPYLVVNNNGSGKWFSDKGYGRRFAEHNGAKMQPVDGVSLEAVFTDPSDSPTDHLFKGLSNWKKNVRTIADATNKGLAIFPWIKFSDESFIHQNADPAIQGYNWASILLAWGSDPGESRVVLQLWKHKPGATNDRGLNLPDILYRNLGKPIGDGPSTDNALEALLVGSSTYMRTWTKGAVFVNPAETEDSGFSVSGYVNADTCAPVTVASMQPNTYRLLLLPQHCD